MENQEKIDALHKKINDMQQRINSFEEKKKTLDERNAMQNETLKKVSAVFFGNSRDFSRQIDCDEFIQSVNIWKI